MAQQSAVYDTYKTTKKGVSYNLMHTASNTYQLEINANDKGNIFTQEHRVLKYFGKRWQKEKIRDDVAKTILNDVYNNLPVKGIKSKNLNLHVETVYKIGGQQYRPPDLKDLHNNALYDRAETRSYKQGVVSTFIGATLLGIPFIGPLIAPTFIGIGIGKQVATSSKKKFLAKTKIGRALRMD